MHERDAAAPPSGVNLSDSLIDVRVLAQRIVLCQSGAIARLSRFALYGQGPSGDKTDDENSVMEQSLCGGPPARSHATIPLPMYAAFPRKWGGVE
ncbi:MAG TPA: hypothetical protein VJV04_15510 [Nitrospiraceae bacterium]|nr:hypothetical protein [Nitrospiraceae bacterium]